MNSYQSLAYLQLQQVQAGGEQNLLDAATTNLKRSLEIARSIKNKLGEANALATLGSAEVLAGNYNEALEYFNLALDVYRQQGNLSNEAFVLLGLGAAEVKLEHFSEATQSYTEALRISGELGNDGGRAEAMNGLAFVYAEQGRNLDEAERLANESVAIFSDISSIARGYGLDTLGWVYFGQKKFDLAVKTLTEAYELYPNPDTKTHLDEAIKASDG